MGLDLAWIGGLWVEEQREVRITMLERPAEEPVDVIGLGDR
jgi:hypothetical protein